jgi:hypothetical protein
VICSTRWASDDFKGVSEFQLNGDFAISSPDIEKQTIKIDLKSKTFASGTVNGITSNAYATKAQSAGTATNAD